MFLKFTRRLSALVAPWLLAGTLLAENPEVEEYDEEDSPPEEPCCPDTCMPIDSGDAEGGGCAPCEETGSIFFSVSLGRTSFVRHTNYVRAMALPAYYASPTYKAFATPAMAHKVRSPFQIQSYYLQSPKTGKKSFRMWIAQENITASSYLASSLLVDEDTVAEKIRDTGGVIRQIRTDDRLADIQPLGTVRSSLPSDLQSVLPTNSEGFVVRTWFAHQAGAKVSGLYTLPTADAVEYMVFYNPDAPADNGRLNVIMKSLYAGTSYKTRSYTYHQDATTHDWTSKQYAGPPGGTGILIKETVLDVTSWTNARDYTQTRTVKEAPNVGTSGWSTPVTVSVTQENFDDISGTSRLVEEIKGYGTTEPRTTKYAYYNTPAASSTHARLNWKTNPDGSFEHYTYTFDFTGGNSTIVKKTPWKDYKWDPVANPGGPTSANCVNETTYSTADTTTVTTQVGATTVAYRTESWADVSGTSVHTEREYYNTTEYLTTATGYHPSTAAAHLAGKIKWKELPDGTAETYSYTTPDANKDYNETVDKGAGNRNGITKGIRTVSMRNRFGFTYNWKRSYFDSTGVYDLEMWDGSTSVDNFGRPTIRTWNADLSDYDQTVFGCCGIASFQDRKGVLTEYFRDDLLRVRKIVETAGSRSVTTTTAFNGLVTEKRRSAGMPLVDVLVSKVWKKLNGETEKTWEPDQNGDSVAEETNYAYSYPSAGGVSVTRTNADGGTEITEYFTDGSIEEVAGTAVAPIQYDYGTHSLVGNGFWTKITRPTAASPTGEWVKTYSDRAGRGFKTEYPTQIKVSGTFDNSEVSFYGSSANLGSRGKIQQTKDPDGVVVSYMYDSEGSIASLSEAMPGTVGNRVTEFIHDAVNDSQLGNSMRKTSKVNGVVVQVDITSGDGYGTRRQLLGGVTASVSSLGSSGDWSEEVVHPDGTRTIRNFDDNLLKSLILMDSSIPGVILESNLYTYDAIGRLATVTHSRTGTTLYNSYTESGNLLSETDSGGRVVIYKYDTMGRKTEADAPDTLDAGGAVVNNITKTSYYLNGQVESVWGDQMYYSYRTYDKQFRPLALHSYRALVHGTKPLASTAGADVTSWEYHPTRGWLIKKTYSDGYDSGTDPDSGPEYAYTASGNLKKRIWARGNTTRYDYDGGRLAFRRYFQASTSQSTVDSASVGNDSVTPDVSYSYDAFGRVIQVANSISSTDYTYHPDNLVLENETVTIDPDAGGARAPVSRTFGRKRDALLRDSGYKLMNGLTIEVETTYGYSSSHGLLDSVTGNTSGTFNYNYESGSAALIGGIDSPVLDVDNIWESDRDIMAGRESRAGTTDISIYGYSVNHLGQRTRVDFEGSAFSAAGDISWGYDVLGQVVAADRSGGTMGDRGYEYDSMGNRYRSSRNTTDPGSAGGSNLAVYKIGTTGSSANGANALNQYRRLGLYGVSGVNQTYDEDGNQSDGIFPQGGTGTRSWDGENRLIQTVIGSNTVNYRYDPFGRRVAKLQGAGTGMTGTIYIYDDWNVAAECKILATTYPLDRTYIWGKDFGRGNQAVGGVGGMLAMKIESGGDAGVYYPTFDGGGNISEYLDSAGNIVAHYEYDPFGEIVNSSGSKAALFSYRFSTKPLDQETGYYYYGYRYYDPVAGRWSSRDPIHEYNGGYSSDFYGSLYIQDGIYELLSDLKALFGGERWDSERFIGSESSADLNLYVFCFNNGISMVDRLGLEPFGGSGAEYRPDPFGHGQHPNGAPIDPHVDRIDPTGRKSRYDPDGKPRDGAPDVPKRDKKAFEEALDKLRRTCERCPAPPGKPTNQGGNAGNEGGRPTNQGGNAGNEGGRPTNQGGNAGNGGGRPTNQGGNAGTEGGRPINSGGNGPTRPVSDPVRPGGQQNRGLSPTFPCAPPRGAPPSPGGGTAPQPKRVNDRP